MNTRRIGPLHMYDSVPRTEPPELEEFKAWVWAILAMALTAFSDKIIFLMRSLF